MSNVTAEKVLESWKNTVHPEDEIEKAASAIIVEALERRIPMKVVVHDSCGNESTSERCPVCFEATAYNWRRYCYNCGQALNWEVEDE